MITFSKLFQERTLLSLSLIMGGEYWMPGVIWVNGTTPEGERNGIFRVEININAGQQLLQITK